MRERHVRESRVKTGSKKKPDPKKKPRARVHSGRIKPTRSGRPGRPARLKRRAGQVGPPSKLDNALQKKLCGMIAGGLRQEDACQLCGITRVTLYNWRTAGAAKPYSRYGRLLADFEKAEALARARMTKKLLDDPDWHATWKIMMNKWPEIYRDSYSLRQEISGPGGAPVPVSVTPFVVEIRCDESLEKLDFGPIIDRSTPPATNGNGSG
jgi:hypothetical protein